MRPIQRSSVVRCLFVFATLAFCIRAIAVSPAKAGEPPFQGLGTHSRKITTTSAAAQQYFDQGLAFLYGFNHDEAIRSFEAAAADDPQCAMAWWGIALANGPHINNTQVDEAHAKAAWKALTKARELVRKAYTVHPALIAHL